VFSLILCTSATFKVHPQCWLAIVFDVLNDLKQPQKITSLDESSTVRVVLFFVSFFFMALERRLEREDPTHLAVQVPPIFSPGDSKCTINLVSTR
jgi:hypothetical protein